MNIEQCTYDIARESKNIYNVNLNSDFSHFYPDYCRALKNVTK